MALAPRLVSDAPLTAELAQNGPTTVTVNCSPEVQPQQTIALIVGSQLVSAAQLAEASSQLSFGLRGFTAGTYLLRVRIDQADSIPVTTKPPPADPGAPPSRQFDPNQKLVLT